MHLITDNRYLAQAGCLPKAFQDAFGPWRHNRPMADFIFDRELVRSTMKERDVSRAQLAEAVGLTHASAVSKLLAGERQIKVQEASAIYAHLGLQPIQGTTTRAIPIIGLTAAGNWREAVEVPIGRMVVPSGVAGERAFAVEVSGDSMNLLIEDGG